MTVQVSSLFRVSFAFLRATLAEFAARTVTIIKGMNGNPAFPAPPVAPAVLQTTLDNFQAVAADGLDSRKARAVRDELFGKLCKMLRANGHYVEVTCNDDLTTFLSSGFEQLVVNRAAPRKLPPGKIDLVDHAGSGTLQVWVNPEPKDAAAREVRYATAAAAAAGGPWVSQSAINTRKPVVFSGLIPGTAYVFQVRSVGKLGFSDWSDPVTQISA